MMMFLEDAAFLQCTATRCSSAATCRNALQHTMTMMSLDGCLCCSELHRTATHCSTLQHNAAHCSTPQHTAAHCKTLQPAAIHYLTLPDRCLIDAG